MRENGKRGTVVGKVLDPVVKWIGGGGIEERKVDFSCIGEDGMKVLKYFVYFYIYYNERGRI